MKRFMLVLFSIFLLTACTAKEDVDSMKDEKAEYKRISAKEAKAMMENEDVIILDVRTNEEYEHKHIGDALLIPNDDVERLAEEKLPHKDATILVYCRSGNRSADASKKLIDMGYTKIYDFGGINSWEYDTVSN